MLNRFTDRPISPWVPSPGRTEVPAGYLLWCQCTAELHELNDAYTRLLVRCTLIDEITRQWQSTVYYYNLSAFNRSTSKQLQW